VGSVRCMKGDGIGARTMKQNAKGTGFVPIVVLAVILVVVVVVSLTLGRYGLPLSEVLHAFARRFGGTSTVATQNADIVMFQVRIPRILAAVLVGAALATSGATYQGLFKNPMVSPDLMGASSGAGFGAVIALLFSLPALHVQLIAFIFGLAAVSLTYGVSKAVDRDGNTILSLVLIGMVVAALFSAFISLVKFVADPDAKLPSITYWLMGGFAGITAPDLPMLVAPVLIGLVPMLLLRYRLNALAFGDQEAKAMGVNTGQIRAVFVICSTIAISASVAASGIIGWVGLIIPHLARIITGPNYRTLLPASMLLGAIYLLLIDNISRLAFSFEIPIGILTAILGAPFFIYLFVKGKRSWL
jgi:iron complex transport system permease protein